MRKWKFAGNAYIEYLLLVILIAFGCMWLYDGGNFQGTKANVESSFDNMINEITTP